MFDLLHRPTIFAHRGACAHAPENTIAAFQLAILQKADAIELDAKLSSDGSVVVMHDQTLDRTTNGEGKISNYSLEVLKELDTGEKFDESFRGEKIPTLSEVFESCGNNIFINVEITNYSSPRDSLPEKIASLVKHHKLENRIMCSSFNPLALRRFSKILPDVPLGLLALSGIRGTWARNPGSFSHYRAIHSAVKDTNRKLINKCHKYGLRVPAYTVNSLDNMLSLFQLGIDGIFTADPILAQSALSFYTEQIAIAK
jgi:glycerophosphoryl diester phosphodiesterase